MSSHCLLASMISDGKSAVNFIVDSSCMRSCFSLVAFKISSVFNNLTTICLGVDSYEFIQLGVH